MGLTLNLGTFVVKMSLSLSGSVFFVQLYVVCEPLILEFS
jgi:hypothetical protein